MGLEFKLSLSIASLYSLGVMRRGISLRSFRIMNSTLSGDKNLDYQVRTLPTLSSYVAFFKVPGGNLIYFLVQGNRSVFETLS
jgi:hypothetical protein